MPLRADSRSRARIRSGIRTTRRRSPCYRHPDEPITGICASCLRERLSGLDASSAMNAASPELRRCRSVVSVSKCEASSSTLNEPRRKSCDVISGRSSLSNLFDADDVRSGSESEAKVESKNVGLSRVTYNVIESKKENHEESRVLSNKLGKMNMDCVDSDAEVEEGDLKTMKEYIDLEFQNKIKKSKDLKEIAGSFWGAASVFSKKLRKWRQKNDKTKKVNNSSKGKRVAGDNGNLKLFQDEKELGENHSETVGRRSCDTEPRFSVDACRISFDEPRASWDGYMIARTIPRLAPMFSVVENGILGNINRFENHRLSVDGPMHSIVEDESSSGASGSGNSNSDSSSSMRGSSFDRSSSVRSFGKKAISLDDRGASPANVKLVITEKELKDWHLSSSRDEGLEKFGSISRNAAAIEDVGSLNMQAKKSVRWRRVRNVFGFRHKNSENVCETFAGNTIDPFIDEASDKPGTEAGEHVRDGGWKLTRSSSVVGSRNSCDVTGLNHRRSVDNVGGYAYMGREDFKLERNTSAKYSSADLDSGVTPFYMTPLRSLRNSKSGKFKLQNTHSVAGHVLQLN
ncbi:UNVERIFIED_CONTAM: protein OCTOPUS-like [Sesamum radiatum]|uniref:Protein OCTOPUS-like n=1 Tax=Sesamum radiatum TaxID=300843 RepID=A0AAW2UQ50_SESRA